MTGDGSILLLLLDWKSPTLAPLARCGSGCSRSVKRLVERKFSPTSSGGQGEEEVSSSTDADGAVAVAALTGREDRRLWTASARRGSGQFQFAFPLDWRVLITRSASCISSGRMGVMRSGESNAHPKPGSRTDTDGSVTVVARALKNMDILTAQQRGQGKRTWSDAFGQGTKSGRFEKLLISQNY